jgi:small GTP-binding protein
VCARAVQLGDSNVGKSSLVLRFVKDQFNSEQATTVGAAFLQSSVPIDNSDDKIQFGIWDTAGSERYKALAPMYYRGAEAAIVVYDITSVDSFEGAKLWIRELKLYGQPNVVVALAANKCDLESNRKVSAVDGRAYAREHDLAYFETSAKTSLNVKSMFVGLGEGTQRRHTTLPCTTSRTPHTLTECVRVPTRRISQPSACPARIRVPYRRLPCLTLPSKGSPVAAYVDQCRATTRVRSLARPLGFLPRPLALPLGPCLSRPTRTRAQQHHNSQAPPRFSPRDALLRYGRLGEVSGRCRRRRAAPGAVRVVWRTAALSRSSAVHAPAVRMEARSARSGPGTTEPEENRRVLELVKVRWRE